jgi:ABC-2 type transport system ATP-binding protein
MRNMIAALRGEHTILLSTHILTEIEHTCDRILMMHKGRIAAEGSEDDLAKRLSQERQLQLEVVGEETALRRALARVSEVSRLIVDRTPQGTMRVTVRVDDAAREKVSRAVVQADLGLLSMESVSSGLEGIFLQLSGAAERADLEAAAPPAGTPPEPPAAGALS